MRQRVGFTRWRRDTLCLSCQALSDRGHSVVLWVPDHPRMHELAHKCKPFSEVVRSDYTNTYDYRTRCAATCCNWECLAAGSARMEEPEPGPRAHQKAKNSDAAVDIFTIPAHLSRKQFGRPLVDPGGPFDVMVLHRLTFLEFLFPQRGVNELVSPDAAMSGTIAALIGFLALRSDAICRLAEAGELISMATPTPRNIIYLFLTRPCWATCRCC